MKCFDKASKLGACSIGLPLIGTGNLDFLYDIVVHILIVAAFDYIQVNPDSPLEEFIVFGDDQNDIRAFEKFKKKPCLRQDLLNVPLTFVKDAR